MRFEGLKEGCLYACTRRANGLESVRTVRRSERAYRNEGDGTNRRFLNSRESDVSDISEVRALSVRPPLPFTRPPGTAPPCSPARISTGTTAWYLPPAWEPYGGARPSRPTPARLSARAHGPRAPASPGRRDPANPRAPRSRSRWTACCSAGCTPTPEMKPPRTTATRKGKAAARTYPVTGPGRRERTRGCQPGSLVDPPAGAPARASRSPRLPTRSPRLPPRSPPLVSLRPRSRRRE